MGWMNGSSDVFDMDENDLRGSYSWEPDILEFRVAELAEELREWREDSKGGGERTERAYG